MQTPKFRAARPELLAHTVYFFRYLLIKYSNYISKTFPEAPFTSNQPAFSYKDILNERLIIVGEIIKQRFWN
jgi:hypothetical protein